MLLYYRTMRDKPGWPFLALLTTALLWLAHAVAFFAHEYSHSFMAWLLGWKQNPLALHYPPFSVAVLLAQFGINENVDYAPIFASGHLHQAGIIAAAGMLVGNGLISWPVSLGLLAWAKGRNARATAMFAYWLLIASLGNFIDYVPVRTFAPDGDTHTLALGFQWSPWLILLLGVPFTAAVVWFLLRTEPQTLHWLFPTSPARRIVMAFLSAFVLFGFYGAAAWVEDCGLVSRVLSEVFVCVLFPLAAVFGWLNTRHSVLTAGRPEAA